MLQNAYSLKSETNVDKGIEKRGYRYVNRWRVKSFVGMSSKCLEQILIKSMSIQAFTLARKTIGMKNSPFQFVKWKET